MFRFIGDNLWITFPSLESMQFPMDKGKLVLIKES